MEELNETQKAREIHEYTTDDIMSAIMRLNSNDSKYVLTQFYKPAELVQVFNDSENYDKFMDQLLSYIALYQVTANAFGELRAEMEVPTPMEYDRKSDQIMDLYNSLSDEEKISIGTKIQKADNLDVSLGKFNETWNNANPLTKGICSGLGILAGLATNDKK